MRIGEAANETRRREAGPPPRSAASSAREPAASSDKKSAHEAATGPHDRGRGAERYRLLVLLTCFNSLRWGELAGPARQHVDTVNGTIVVERAVMEPPTGKLVYGPPKSEASVRVVTVPNVLLPHLAAHLRDFTGQGKTALLFVGPNGAPLRRSNFQDHWRKARTEAGVPGLRFHDLRHAGTP